VLGLDEIRRALAGHRPGTLEIEATRRAAVALLLRECDRGPELLFIERARRRGDPWSGHMAFPGGRVDPGDDGPRAAAERETLEEVGISLVGAEALGRLDDIQGRHAGRTLPLVISAYVYAVEPGASLRTNWEVADAFWVPLRHLVDPEHRVDVPSLAEGYPGIRVGSPDRHIVWGLTYRFLEIFLGLLGHPLPDRWNRPG
jgi:8-oxo-dGTP pyrophosphatase MutT (NUDIX family)